MKILASLRQSLKFNNWDLIHNYKLFFVLIAAILPPAITLGNNFMFPKLKEKGNRIKDFIPSGWEIKDSTMGDLNHDGLNDIAMIIQKIDSLQFQLDDSYVSKEQPRIIAVVVKSTKPNNYKLLLQNNNFVPMFESVMLNEPISNLFIRANELNIVLKPDYTVGPGWYTQVYEYKFLLFQNELKLVTARTIYSNIADASSIVRTYDFKAMILRELIIKNEKKYTKIQRIKLPTLLSLKDLKQAFTLKINENYI